MTTVQRSRANPKAPDIGASLTFDLSRPGRKGVLLPEPDVPRTELPEPRFLRTDLNLPELSQNQVVRYFFGLSRLNYGVDTGFYPLGSCTMKYNPMVNEDIGRMPGFTLAHPLQPQAAIQGAMVVMYELQQALASITGMDAVGLAPAAGAQGELCGMLIVKAYLDDHPDRGSRRKVLIPDSAHGTNPASAAICQYQVVPIKSGPRGVVEPAAVAEAMDEDVACIMITNPNTLGLFEEHIAEIARIVHAKGGQVYGDGANLNALLGIARPGDMGIDAIHTNLHKTFTQPHGGGGPGAGPVAVKAHLAPFLPVPVIENKGDRYVLNEDRPKSIGKIRSFAASFGVMVRSYAYIRSLGPEGLRRVSDVAVANANYILSKLRGAYNVPFDRICKHECVLDDQVQLKNGVKTLDIAKRLMDYGFHPPTIYFPLIVHGAIMIEPTETEPKETLDQFIEAMLAIAQEAETEPDTVRNAPHFTRVSRMDEARAARQPNLRWRPKPAAG